MKEEHLGDAAIRTQDDEGQTFAPRRYDVGRELSRRRQSRHAARELGSVEELRRRAAALPFLRVEVVERVRDHDGHDRPEAIELGACVGGRRDQHEPPLANVDDRRARRQRHAREKGAAVDRPDLRPDGAGRRDEAQIRFRLDEAGGVDRGAGSLLERRDEALRSVPTRAPTCTTCALFGGNAARCFKQPTRRE